MLVAGFGRFLRILPHKNQYVFSQLAISFSKMDTSAPNLFESKSGSPLLALTSKFNTLALVESSLEGFEKLQPRLIRNQL